MALSRVYVLCATVFLTIVKVHTTPVSGLLSGLFGGEDRRRPQPSPVDINQLLQQYYNQQPDDQVPSYNPYAPQPIPLNYPPPPPAPMPVQFNGYPSVDQMPYQPNYNMGYQDPYAQYLPYLRGGPGVPSGAESADPYGKQLDSLLPSGNDQLAYADPASGFRSLGGLSASESQPQPVASQAGAEPAPVAASLMAQRMLPEGSSSSKSASSVNEGSVKEQ